MSYSEKKKEKQKELKKDEKKHKKSWMSKIAPNDWRVREKSGASLSLKVVLPAGAEPLQIKINSTTRVLDIKQQVKSLAGYFPTQYKLTFEGSVLEDSKTLDVYNISNGSEVAVVLHSGMNGYGFRPEDINHKTLQSSVANAAESALCDLAKELGHAQSTHGLRLRSLLYILT
eukprot:CAMPEP_0114625280 /NCGR_PEP_ID=MMETSP0168-20121206/11190_1 /TAXON_ID=95228 ORGANISM="Vannella sp., Strain DIVA3 517/6/12" /NCGR_SAMPLE_ID=MMETSP0168 /ASSEMBLY_ACC=CAM_ASM_000044 /LENGTH=172 /DNA_ID=CAMNT_0001836559 /DNA_START=12 /DNA_END=527 /DNA_ORIENTATION=-